MQEELHDVSNSLQAGKDSIKKKKKVTLSGWEFTAFTQKAFHSPSPWTHTHCPQLGSYPYIRPASIKQKNQSSAGLTGQTLYFIYMTMCTYNINHVLPF